MRLACPSASGFLRLSLALLAFLAKMANADEQIMAMARSPSSTGWLSIVITRLVGPIALDAAVIIRRSRLGMKLLVGAGPAFNCIM